MIVITPKILQSVETFRAESLDSLQQSRLGDDLIIQLQSQINKAIDDVVTKAIQSTVAVAVTTATPAPVVTPSVVSTPVYYANN